MSYCISSKLYYTVSDFTLWKLYWNNFVQKIFFYCQGVSSWKPRCPFIHSHGFSDIFFLFCSIFFSINHSFCCCLSFKVMDWGEINFSPLSIMNCKPYHISKKCFTTFHRNRYQSKTFFGINPLSHQPQMEILVIWYSVKYWKLWLV